MTDQQGYTPKALPGNTSHAISDVIAAAQILEDIYCAEIDALKKPDTGAFIDLQSSKIEAAQNYYSIMTQMLERKNELKNANPAMKKRLKEMHTRFSNTTEENLEVIKRMKRYTARLGDTLRNAAIKASERNSAFSYGENGKRPETSPRKVISSGLCETV
ncbi:MAG: hypothetical protein KAJ29_05095 [Alphaproteobacteria bacterium]|nr:hypothetical protein [Alphaproteobacteria bacterium]